MGDKFGLLNAQTLGRVRVPLPAGDLATYQSSTNVSSYAHSDWENSIRLGTTASRTLYGDVGIAPLGGSLRGNGKPLLCGHGSRLGRRHE
jgi:hypothetical protein